MPGYADYRALQEHTDIDAVILSVSSETAGPHNALYLGKISNSFEILVEMERIIDRACVPLLPNVLCGPVLPSTARFACRQFLVPQLQLSGEPTVGPDLPMTTRVLPIPGFPIRWIP